MEEIDIHAKLAQIETAPHFSMIFDGDTEKAEMIAEHLMWLHSIRRERPLVSRPYKVGIYIRYFNQTRYDNYWNHFPQRCHHRRRHRFQNRSCRRRWCTS